MNGNSMPDWLAEAQREGLVPADAALASQEHRPWPVVLLTAVGAWFAAVPVLLLFSLVLGDVLDRGPTLYLCGALLLAGAWVVLRAEELPAFVDQLAVPAALSGAGLLGWALYRDLPFATASALLCVLALAYGASIGRAWLRVLVGATAAGLFIAALMPESLVDRWSRHGIAFWVATHGALVVWVAALLAQKQAMGEARGARAAIATESLAAGWLLTVVAAMAWRSGSTFLVGAATGAGFASELAQVGRSALFGTFGPADLALATASAALALAGAALLLWRWPAARHLAGFVAAAMLAVLAFFLPYLGGVLLALAFLAASHRWLLAGAAAVAALWIVGAFYYQLAWPLAFKAVVLMGVGAVLGGLGWVHLRAASVRAETPPGAVSIAARPLRLWVGASLLLVLAVANVSIWQKETTLREGQPVFVALAPVDPRSLMQGDFMAINFALPGEAPADLTGADRPHAIARRDARGVATVLRFGDATTPLAADEMRIELTPKNGRWILVTDAYFFREGDAPRFAKAKYGEFRVEPSGRALLVGLADESLVPIRPR